MGPDRCGLLPPDLRRRPRYHAHVSSQEKAFTRQNGGLVRLLTGLERTPLIMRVYGTAGCGKSLIAQHVFTAALTRGKRPALVCYNHPLAEKFKAILPPGAKFRPS